MNHNPKTTNTRNENEDKSIIQKPSKKKHCFFFLGRVQILMHMSIQILLSMPSRRKYISLHRYLTKKKKERKGANIDPDSTFYSVFFFVCVRFFFIFVDVRLILLVFFLCLMKCCPWIANAVISPNCNQCQKISAL